MEPGFLVRLSHNLECEAKTSERDNNRMLSRDSCGHGESNSLWNLYLFFNDEFIKVA